MKFHLRFERKYTTIPKGSTKQNRDPKTLPAAKKTKNENRERSWRASE